MVIVTTTGKYWIHFRHVKEQKLFALRPNYRTECFIHKGPCVENARPCKTEGQFGAAYCSPKDNFDRATGRKLALSRAMQPFDRKLRKEIWLGYFEKWAASRGYTTNQTIKL